jgi:hypothetical protein
LVESGTTTSYTGDGYSGVYIWGAQLEEGAFATSYIPTVASQVTRSADSASMTGTNFSSWYRADEGTLYAESPLFVGIGKDFVVVEVFNSSAINARKSMFLENSSNNFVYRTANSANTVTDLRKTSATPTSNVKYSAGWKFSTSFVGGSFNGETALTSSSAVTPLEINTLHIGRSRSGTAYRNGTISKVAFYPKCLSDAELQGLATI